MEWIKSSPVKSFKPPKTSEQEVVPFTEDEVKKVLKACDDFEGTNRKSLKALTHLMLASGLRIGDAVMISKKTITKDRQGHSLALRTEKTGATVTCPLQDDVAREVLAIDKGDYPFWTGKSNAEDCAAHWRKSFSKLFKQAGVPGHSHQFRHTFAKRLLIAGVPLGTVAILLGHRKVAITEKHYSRWITERQAVVDAAVRGSWKD